MLYVPRCRSASRSSSLTYRQRSSSRSSHQPSSPHLPRLIPPPIEELPSQSESSSSDSPHPFRTVETLKKILDEQPQPQPNSNSKSGDLKGKSPHPLTFTCTKYTAKQTRGSFRISFVDTPLLLTFLHSPTYLGEAIPYVQTN